MFLHVHGLIPGPVLEELDVPSLLSLRITADTVYRHHSLCPIPKAPLRQFPRHPHVSFEPSHADSNGWLDNLVNVVEGMNSLDVMYVSALMAGLLMKRS